MRRKSTKLAPRELGSLTGTTWPDRRLTPHDRLPQAGMPGEAELPGPSGTAWLVPSVGNGVVHRAVRGLGDGDVVRGVWGGRLRGRHERRGRPGGRTRGAVLQALLVVERGQVVEFGPGCFLGCNRPGPGEPVGDVVQRDAELPILDRNLKSEEAELNEDPVAGCRAAGDYVGKDWVKSRAICGLIHAEQQLLALGVLARVVGAARAGKGGRACQENQQTYADH